MKRKSDERELLQSSRPLTNHGHLMRRELTTAKSENSTGFTTVDVLCARALVRAYLDLDYSEEIALARKFAALAERREVCAIWI